MRFVSSFLLLLLAGAAGPALAQISVPPGAYRSAAAYRHRQPQPAGADAFYPDKRGQLVVVVPRGPGSVKLRVAPDSVWGFVSDKARTFRIFRGEEFRLEHADTLCVYTRISTAENNGVRTGTTAGQLSYYFSRGLTGLIFPLTVSYLREAYAASNPQFVSELSNLRFDKGLSDYDRKTGLYRVTTIYRQAAAH